MDLVVAGRPVFVSEIASDSEQQQQQLEGQTVRLTGTLQWYDPRTERALLTDGTCGCLVDTRLLGVGRYAEGQTYQVIGCLTKGDGQQERVADVQCSGTLVLRARVARLVEGLDVEVYGRAVAAMREAGIL